MVHPSLSLWSTLSALDPGYDLRTIITGIVVTAATAVVVYGAVKFARWIARVVRWFGRVIGDALLKIFIEGMRRVMLPEIADLRNDLADLSLENATAHSEVAKHLAANDEHLKTIDRRLDEIERKAEERAKQFRSTDPQPGV